MMGTTHAFTGASAALVVSQGQPWQIWVYAGAVGAVAALLPDLDHPASHAAQALGPFRWLGSRAIAWIFGGHRMGTHSIAVSLAFTALVAWTGSLWLTVAAGVGYFVGGVVPDTMTKHGCALLWPFTRRTFGLKWGTTGGWIETVWWVFVIVITGASLWLIA